MTAPGGAAGSVGTAAPALGGGMSSNESGWVAESSAERPRSFEAPGGVLMIAAGLLAWVLARTDADAYYRWIQEDEVVEWATVGFLLVAAIAYGLCAAGRAGWGRTAPVLLTLFCVFVAGEEISWGQRVLGLQPPEIFLEHNDQQELNLHNTLPKDLRKSVLPLLLATFALSAALRCVGGPFPRIATALGFVPPRTPLALGFAFATGFYLAYPIRFAGEWVELILESGLAWHAVSPLGRGIGAWIATAVALLFAFGAASWARGGREIDPQLIELARVELDALAEDHRRGSIRSECGTHKRLYRYLPEGVPTLSFNALRERGLPEERAEFFLDPWNSPYWLRDHCTDDGERRTVLYSFGPNRLRESSRTANGGDDLVVDLSPRSRKRAPAPFGRRRTVD